MCSIVLNRHSLLNLHHDGQQLDGNLLEQRIPPVVDDADIVIVPLLIAFLRQLVHIKLTLILALVDQVVGDLDGRVRVVDGLLVLVDLAE